MAIFRSRARAVVAVLSLTVATLPNTAAGQTVKPGAATDRSAIEAIVREYLLAHPELVLEAEQRGRENVRRATMEANRKALETPYAAAAIGPADADVTIVEFMDYGCHFCRDTAPELDRLLAGDKRVRLVPRQYPVLSELSAQAARVALLAGEKGNFPAYHRALYAAPELTTDAILKAAADAGLTAAEARAAATDTKRDREFASNETLGHAIGASGTPTFVIGGELYSGAMRRDTLAAAVTKARGRSGAAASGSVGQ